MRRFLMLLAGCAFVLVVMAATSHVAQTGTVAWNAHSRPLGGLGGSESEAYAINERAQVVGWADTNLNTMHAFLWQNGKMRDLGTLGGHDSRAVAINERGQVVGSSFVKYSDYPFLWQKGKMINLGSLRKGIGGDAYDINNRGQIVGESNRHAFLWEKGKMIDLGTLPGWRESLAVAINDRGQILGEATKDSNTHAVLWTLKR